MSAYLIADITIHDLENFMEYVKQVPACIKKHGGTYLVRGGEPEAKEGTWEPKRLVVLKFPTKENAEAFLEDPEYQPVAAIRHQAATTNLILADGYG